MTAYQELESTKYLTEEFEVERQQRISGQQNATEFWSLVAFYSTIVVVGFFPSRVCRRLTLWISFSQR